MNIGWGNGEFRQKIITRANVDSDLCRHIMLLGDNELNNVDIVMEISWWVDEQPNAGGSGTDEKDED